MIPEKSGHHPIVATMPALSSPAMTATNHEPDTTTGMRLAAMTPTRLRDAMTEVAQWAPTSTITVKIPGDDRVFVIAGMTKNERSGQVALDLHQR